jgi:methyl-accepting chemotaxis protein
MKYFNVSRQLALLLSAFAIMTVLTLIAFTYFLRQTLDSSTRVSHDATAQLALSYSLLESLSDTHGRLQVMLRLKDPDELEKALKEVEVHQQASTALITNGTAAIAALKPKNDALIIAQKAVIEDVLRGSVADAYDKFFSQAATQLEVLLVEIGLQNAKVQKNTAAALDTHTLRTNRKTWWQTAIAALVLTALVVFGWRLKTRIVRELQRVSTVLGDSSVQLAGAIGQVSASSQALAEGASEQAASLEETSASLEEMSSMTERNADNAGKAHELAKQARAVAERGADDMQAMSQAMNDIKTSSDDIAKIIKTIDEIAFQTNILALNAAVEAARAGESGMGFAVVAEEVRNLAQRSARAARDTADKIEGAMVNTAQGVELNAKVAEALHEIVGRIRQVDDLVAEVSTASNEQSNGIRQLNTAVTQMDKVVQSNAAGAEESAAAGQQLNAQAGSLKALASGLQELVGGASPPPRSGKRSPDEAKPTSAASPGMADAAHRDQSHPQAKTRNLTSPRPQAPHPQEMATTRDSDFNDF